MISRHIPILPENDNYRRLANYIADASHKGEKALMSWCAGCWSGDDEYQLAIHEVEAVQAMNTRSTKEKTYHLVISFRPEDEAKLTPEVFKEIEQEFAQALGFDEHQRHCGVHRNTANIHLHIAFCQIHPVRFTKHEPFHDFAIRDRLCRKLEQRYGLMPDNGRDPEQQAAARNDKAKAYEARTGQESLFAYVQCHKPDIMNDLLAAATWADCHRVFAGYGLLIKSHGNGLVIQDMNSKHFIKASDLDRGLSKGKLEKRFGSFEVSSHSADKDIATKHSYTAKPLQRDADRDNLYAEFCQAMNERRTEMENIREQEASQYKVLRQRWDKIWVDIKRMPMLRQHRKEAQAKFADKKKAELAAFRNQIKQSKDDIRNRYPFTAWNKFLQHKASQGNETALAILRSRQEKAQPQAKGEYISARDQNTLAAVLQMREVLAEESAPLRNAPLKYHVDDKGIVIFNLPDNVTIRDAGQAIYFSANNEKAEELATKLAKVRWGQSVTLKGNKLVGVPMAEQQIQQDWPMDLSGVGR
jgi:hypothetical protein